MLERWIVEFIPSTTDSNSLDWDDPAKESQPTSIYKQAVILMRSLYTFTHVLPAWTLRKRLSRSKLTVSPLKVGCRILNGSHRIPSKGRVGLSKQIKDAGDSELEAFTFSDLKTPLGSLRISVSYRQDCNFSVSDTESLLSNHFYDLDKTRNTMAARRQSFSAAPHFNSASFSSEGGGGGGSSSMASRASVYRNQPKHAGSASSSEFQEPPHATNTSAANNGAPPISSPTDFVARDRRLSNLSLRDSASYSPLMTQHSGTPPTATTSTPTTTMPTGSVPSSSQSPTSARPSVSFIQPFKTPSLSASPIDSTPFRPSSFSRNPSNSSLAASLRIPGRTMSNASNSSINSVRAAAPGSAGNDNAISSSVSSSRSSSSVPKFSSSFGSRGNFQRSGSISSSTRSKRFSNYGEPGSLGSVSSSTEPGASLLIDDDDGLGEFVQMVDSISVAKPTSSNSILLSGGSSGSNSSMLFSRPTGASGPSYGNENDVLSKFQHMRDSYSALSDSLLGSQHRGTSDGSISPGGTTGSGIPLPIPTNSPPLVSKAISQHTPSVPSRLSEEFTANDSFKAYYYSQPRKQGSISSLRVDEEEIFAHDHDELVDTASNHSKMHPLDIPMPNSLTRGLGGLGGSGGSSGGGGGGHARRESLSVNTRRESAFKDLPERHNQSLGAAPGHIFPGRELSSFRSNAAADNQQQQYQQQHNQSGAGSQPKMLGLVARRATDTGFSAEMLAQQVRAVDINSSSPSSGGGVGGGSSMSRRPSRFSYYLEDDDDVDDERRKRGGHPGAGLRKAHADEEAIDDDDDDGNATNGHEDEEDDVFYFALNEDAQAEGTSGGGADGGSGGAGGAGGQPGGSDNAPPFRTTTGNRFDALAWE